MGKTVHTCSGCVPIDASILKVYAAMVGAISESQGLVIDDALSGVSKNPVENRVITNALTSKYTKPANGIPASDIADGVIPDVSGFVTKSVSDLANYYLKSETYTKSEVQEMIGAIQGFSYEVVASLPTASASTKGKIYLVPSGDPQTQNIKDEFITIDNGASASPRYTWEQIGSTSVNLEGYVTTAQLNTALADYTTTANLTSLLAAKQDVIQDLSTIRSGAAAGATAYQKPGTGIPASDLASGVIPTVPTISTDVSADAASDIKTSSPKSVKTYVDSGIAAVESDLSDLEDVVGAIDIGAYVIAWDGNSTPVVANIPAGVTVTYNTTTYTGELAASASTIQKIYLVATGTTDNYDRYITVGDSTYSWVNLGTTEITLADYATKAGVSQLEAKVDDLEDVQNYLIIKESGTVITKDDFSISGVYKTTEMAISANANYKSTPIYDVEPGQVFVWTDFPVVPNGPFAMSLYDENGTPVTDTSLGMSNNRVVKYYIPASGYTIPSGVKKVGFVWDNGTYPLTAQSKITSGSASLELTQSAKELIEDVIDDVVPVQEITDSIEELGDDIEKTSQDLANIIESVPAEKLTISDFTITGLWKTAIAEIDPSYENYSAVALINVTEGQIITFHKWQQGSALSAVAGIFCYDNDGLPFDGSYARRDYSLFKTTDYVNGEYTFEVPSNCSQVGLSFNFVSYPVQTGAEIIIQEESIALTDLAKELVNNAVEQGNEVGDDSAKYYLKGNSNIVYSPAKKLGIIAAGQSNIDGRNSYSDLPVGFVNPNAKVRFCNNVNGTFSDFQVTDGGANNDWSFDAIVYDLLTKSAYGNQSEIFVMKKSMGGTSIDPLGATEYHWTADYEFLNSPSASLLRTFETIVRKGVETQGTNFDIKAMLWHQGEGDMQNESVASRYYENLKNMLAYVRGVVGNPRLYFFCGNISLNRTSPGYVEIINAAYTKLASEDPYFKVVDMSNAQLEDGYHFNYQWSIYFGQKVYDLMIDAGIISGTKINPSEPS